MFVLSLKKLRFPNQKPLLKQLSSGDYTHSLGLDARSGVHMAEQSIAEDPSVT